MKYFLSCLIFLAAIFPQQAVTENYPPVPSIQELADYILDNQVSPEDYIIGKFIDHNVVFLGEFHRIRHDAELVQRLIPLCYQNGIRVLALEFANKKDQPLIDSLLTLPTYNETLARQVTFNNGPDWAYREYLDIYKAAWKLNNSLPEGASPFRIIGVNCTGDWSVMRTRADLQNDSLRRVVWQGCPDGEREWAFAILKRVWAGEKVLVYCGIHHAFTRYIQPIVDNNGDFSGFNHERRMARHVWLRLGQEAITIALHSPWYQARPNREFAKPVNGVIDTVMLTLGDRFRPVGFDVKGSPFGNLLDSASLYQAGYQDFRLRDYCDGYIFQRPFEQYETVRFVEDFINTSNFSIFQQQSADPWFREATLEQSVMSLKRQLKREQQTHRGLSSNSGEENPDPD